MDSLVLPLAFLANIHILIVWIESILRGLRKGKKQSGNNNACSCQLPFVSILIPAWNERMILERLIINLQKINYPSWEVILIAGGTDDTYQEAVQITKGLNRYQVIRQEAGGKNQALNQGMKVSRGEVIVLLDADSVVTQEWLREMIMPIVDGYQAVTGRALPLRMTPIALAEQMERISVYEVNSLVTIQGNGSIALRREVIGKIGGFPENVKVGVDWDLGIRLSSLGISCFYARKAFVYTERPSTIPEFWKNEIRWRRAHLKSIFLHGDTFLRTPISAFRSLYIYILAFISIAFTLLAVIAFPLNQLWIFDLWLIFILWLLLRRAALTGEIIAYTGKFDWIRICWVPPMLLCLTFLAIIPAVFTFHRNLVHFQGPRPQTPIAHEK